VRESGTDTTPGDTRSLFRGRVQELAALRAVLRPESTVDVAWVHGLPGIGKTAVVEELVRGSSDDAVVELVDRPRPVGAEGAALRSWIAGLPPGSRVVVTAQVPPDRGWYDGGWDARLQVLPLRRLSDAEAQEVLEARGVTDPALSSWLTAWAGGLPLALVVGAVEARQCETPDEQLSHRLDDLLLPLLLEACEPVEAWDAPRRTALEVAAMAGEVDVRLLEAVTPDHDAAAALAWLRGLPWTSSQGEAVRLERQVRRLVADELARRSPGRAGELRARLVSELLGRTLAGERRLVSEVREVLAMPGNLDGLDTSSVHLWVDDARDSDLRALPGLVGSHGPDYAAWVRRWFETAPEHALVVRDDASPAFVTLWATADRHPEWAAEDPLLRTWLEDARRRGIADDSVFQLSTDLVGEDAHFAQIVALVAGEILQRAGRTRVQWWYHAVHAEDEQAAEWTTHLGSEPRTGLSVRIGSAGLATYVLDLGVGEHPQLPPRPVVDAAAIRAALRDIDQPVLLAAHVLARGSTIAARAGSVRDRLTDAVDTAFGRSSSEQLYRQVLRRGYLDPDAGAHVAQRELHLGRSTYFRRVAEAIDRLAAYFADGSG